MSLGRGEENVYDTCRVIPLPIIPLPGHMFCIKDKCVYLSANEMSVNLPDIHTWAYQTTVIAVILGANKSKISLSVVQL